MHACFGVKFEGDRVSFCRAERPTLREAHGSLRMLAACLFRRRSFRLHAAMIGRRERTTLSDRHARVEPSSARRCAAASTSSRTPDRADLVSAVEEGGEIVLGAGPCRDRRQVLNDRSRRPHRRLGELRVCANSVVAVYSNSCRSTLPGRMGRSKGHPLKRLDAGHFVRSIPCATSPTHLPAPDRATAL